jgi:uncharacterized Zn finger protein
MLNAIPSHRSGRPNDAAAPTPRSLAYCPACAGHRVREAIVGHSGRQIVVAGRCRECGQTYRIKR